MTKPAEVDVERLKSIMDAKSGEFFEVLKEESDRGMVLVGAALLSELLGELLLANTVKGLSKTAKDHLLDLSGPCGAFSHRIAICQAFGLISPGEGATLDAIRLARNEAAHFTDERISWRFSDPHVKAKIGGLPAIGDGKKWKLIAPRMKLIVSIMTAVANLRFRTIVAASMMRAATAETGMMPGLLDALHSQIDDP